MDDVEWSPRMRSSWTAVRKSCSRRISALTWMRSLPYDHLIGVRIVSSTKRQDTHRGRTENHWKAAENNRSRNRSSSSASILLLAKI
jgi:hypothetical protein